ncbi:MAG TPA: hypothetical protein VFO41_08045 [Alphaproteobacteria bacterium]|nr:hypothetical protein [Alphaproteobacteria bacterium]
MTAAARPRRPGLIARLVQLDDGVIVRTAFYLLLAVAVTMLYLDWRQLSANDVNAFTAPSLPVLPAYDPDSPSPPPGPAVTTDPAVLNAPLAVTLGNGGVLSLRGTIDPGAAERVAAALASEGEYVTTVALDSPGGSVDGAIAIGKAIRAHGYETSVARGSICASSCPLMLAGGVERQVSDGAAVGVHQIYAAVKAGALAAPLAAGEVISQTQKSTAEITRYLTASGVDPALWLHALDTPPDRLYYLSPKELTAYRLATKIAG